MLFDDWKMPSAFMDKNRSPTLRVKLHFGEKFNFHGCMKISAKDFDFFKPFCHTFSVCRKVELAKFLK